MRSQEITLLSKEKCYTSHLAKVSPYTHSVNEQLCPPYQLFRARRRTDIEHVHLVLGSVLPLLAAKQRVTHANDWMTTDAEIACPDPNCPSRLRIVRTGVRTFSHGEVTAVSLPRPEVASSSMVEGNRRR